MWKDGEGVTRNAKAKCRKLLSSFIYPSSAQRHLASYAMQLSNVQTAPSPSPAVSIYLILTKTLSESSLDAFTHGIRYEHTFLPRTLVYPLSF